ncbi:unnamed protein product, partial [Cyprideis torosa]
MPLLGRNRPRVFSDSYSPGIGFIYIFNLIVGTGALTLPAAFAHAGWALSLLILTILAFMSYMTTTFVVESMAAANAVIRLARGKRTPSVFLEPPSPPHAPPSEHSLVSVALYRSKPSDDSDELLTAVMSAPEEEEAIISLT